MVKKEKQKQVGILTPRPKQCTISARLDVELREAFYEQCGHEFGMLTQGVTLGLRTIVDVTARNKTVGLVKLCEKYKLQFPEQLSTAIAYAVRDRLKA